MISGVNLIAEERARQIALENLSLEHDDQHIKGELPKAAMCYSVVGLNKNSHPAGLWPWDLEWWKPSNNPIRNLEKAGALIAAEIDRLQRKSDIVEVSEWCKVHEGSGRISYHRNLGNALELGSAMSKSGFLGYVMPGCDRKDLCPVPWAWVSKKDQRWALSASYIPPSGTTVRDKSDDWQWEHASEVCFRKTIR